MKTALVILLFVIGYEYSNAQGLDKFFYAKGVSDLSYCAHISNTYVQGNYDIESDYIDVSIQSYDSLFERNIYTTVRVGKGIGGLYFSSLSVLKDNDIVDPFAAFGLQSSFLVALAKEIDSDDYRRIQQAMIQYFNTDIEHWNGAMWALFALNLDYFFYTS